MTGFIGILTLDTAFPRIIGDAGNPDSYHMPARTLVVRGAGSTDIVQNGPPSERLIAAFCDAAKQLERDGAVAIVSTCGFLIHIQHIIAAHVGIPVLLSALSMYPDLTQKHPTGPLGILTASRPALLVGGLSAASIPAQKVQMAGLEGIPEFAQVFLANKSNQARRFDPKTIEHAVVKVAISLQKATPEITAFLLECGNLPPYAKAIEAAIKCPVYSILEGIKAITGRAHS